MSELMGLDRVTSENVKSKVMVVEGAKALELLRSKLRNPVIAWDGDASTFDWTPLARRSCIVWPDIERDALGRAVIAANKLTELDCDVRLLLELQKGPVAYAMNGWDSGQVKAGIDRTRIWEPAPDEEPEPEPAQTEGKKLPPMAGGLPLALGMRDNYCVLLDRRGPQVVEYPREALGRRTLMHLADLEDWQQSEWSGDGRNGGREVDWDKAANEIVAMCVHAGHVSPDRVRGLGVYRDGGSIVANLDRNALWVDGKMVPVSKHMTRFVYIAQAATVPLEAPMSSEWAKRIGDAICQLRWVHPFYGKMFAGWLAVAPICGALSWRPNVWLTGPSGCGKTTVLDLVVRPLLHEIAFMTSQSTTEAGIRQENSGRSIPVIWDEFEAETRRDDDKRKGILELVRAATSGDGTIVKGTPGGGSRRFSVRFAFLFASINASLKMRADLSRTFMVELQGPSRNQEQKVKDSERFSKWQREVTSWPDDAGRRWVWRSVELAETILENIKTITKAMLAYTDRRTADRDAPMLAGWYSITDDRLINQEDARNLAAEWFDAHSVVDHTNDDDETSEGQHDERNLVRRLMDSWAKVSVDGRVTDVSIRELVKAAIEQGGRSDPHRVL